MQAAALTVHWNALRAADEIIPSLPEGGDGSVQRFLSLVTLTFDLDIQTFPCEGPNTSSL